MEANDQLVEAALDAMPLASTPPHFTGRVMARVRQPGMAFRLDFLDFALPVFFAFLAALGLAGAALLLRWIDPLLVVELQFDLQMAALRLSVLPGNVLLPAFFAAGMLGVVSLALLLGCTSVLGSQSSVTLRRAHKQRC